MHAEGELIGLDHSVNSTLISLLFLQVTVHLLNEIDLASLQVPGKAVASQILQVCVLDRAPEASDGCALVEGREKCASVVLGSTDAGRRRKADESGEILVFGSEAVEDPRPHGGADELETAGVKLNEGLGVRWDIPIHSIQEAEIISVLGELGEKFGDRKTTLASGSELPRAFHDSAAADLLSVVSGEPRFVVEGVDMRGPSAHAGKDHPLGLPREMSLF